MRVNCSGIRIVHRLAMLSSTSKMHRQERDHQSITTGSAFDLSVDVRLLREHLGPSEFWADTEERRPYEARARRSSEPGRNRRCPRLWRAASTTCGPCWTCCWPRSTRSPCVIAPATPTSSGQACMTSSHRSRTCSFATACRPVARPRSQQRCWQIRGRQLDHAATDDRDRIDDAFTITLDSLLTASRSPKARPRKWLGRKRLRVLVQRARDTPAEEAATGRR